MLTDVSNLTSNAEELEWLWERFETPAQTVLFSINFPMFLFIGEGCALVASSLKSDHTTWALPTGRAEVLVSFKYG